MRPLFISMMVILAAGCASTQGQSTGERRVTFDCSQGEEIEMRFLPQGVAVLVHKDTTLELQQRPSASGFIYSDGPNTVRGKGNDLTVEIGRMMPLKCRAR